MKFGANVEILFQQRAKNSKAFRKTQQLPHFKFFAPHSFDLLASAVCFVECTNSMAHMAYGAKFVYGYEVQ